MLILSYREPGTCTTCAGRVKPLQLLCACRRASKQQTTGKWQQLNMTTKQRKVGGWRLLSRKDELNPPGINNHTVLSLGLSRTHRSLFGPQLVEALAVSYWAPPLRTYSEECAQRYRCYLDLPGVLRSALDATAASPLPCNGLKSLMFVSWLLLVRRSLLAVA